MKAIITVGISASGKTTFAKEMQEHGYVDINRDWIRFNIVHNEEDWRTYKFNHKNEQKVTEVQGKMITEAWANEQNICISDTNLDTRTRNRLVKQLSDLGYEVELKWFPISLTEAWKRDTFRKNGVGRDIIYKQWQKWNEAIGRKTYKTNYNLPATVIVDIDGTIAEMHDRKPFEWSKVGQDKPRYFIIDMVINYERQGYEIVIVSGRSDECRADTEKWLAEHGVPYSELHMRKKGDFRKDDAVKEEIFWTNIAEKYNVQGVIDDRPQVLRLWWDLKVPNVICVGNPYLEF